MKRAMLAERVPSPTGETAHLLSALREEIFVQKSIVTE